MSPSKVAALLSSGKDFDLLTRLKRRDPTAMGDLYESYGVVLYSLLLRMAGTAAVAEDLLSEILMEVWNRSITAPPNHSALGLWIFSLARNRAIQVLGNIKERPSLANSEILKPLNNPRLYKDFEIDNNLSERLRRLHAAFEGMAQQTRSMLEMSFFEGTSVPEIAAKFQQPAAVVEETVKTALALLAECERLPEQRL